MEEKSLVTQLFDFSERCVNASCYYWGKSEKIDNRAFQGTKNLSAEGVGGLVTGAGLVGKIIYSGARIIENVTDVSQSFSNVLDAAAVPFNLAAGLAIAGGVSLIAGTAINEKLSNNACAKQGYLSSQVSYARSALAALEKGDLTLGEGATIEDAMNAMRDEEVALFVADGGEMKDAKEYYPSVDMEKTAKLITKAENARDFNEIINKYGEDLSVVEPEAELQQ